MTTYTKLRDGSWGLRISGSAQAGQTISVTKKSGDSKTETVGRILWTGNGITLATVANGHSHRSSSSRSGCGCNSSCCRGRCECGRTCNCRGGNIYDC